MSSATAGAPAPQSELFDAKYFVVAVADPGIAPRLVEPFAKLGLVPSRVHLSNEDGAGEEVSADLRVRGVDAMTAHLIDKALRRVVGVRQVIALVEA